MAKPIEWQHRGGDLLVGNIKTSKQERRSVLIGLSNLHAPQRGRGAVWRVGQILHKLNNR